MLLSIDQPSHRSWDADCLVSDQAGVGNHLTLGVKIHVAACGLGSFFAVIKEMCLAVSEPQKHEAAAADVSRRRMHNRQSKPGCNSGVHGVATSPHDLRAHLRGFLVDAYHHG